MIDPQKVDINQLPKKFIDGAIGSYGKEGFSFVLTSGNEPHSFMTTPANMKSISEWLMKQVEAYEKQFGIIDMSISDIPSPIQISDLGGSNKK